MPSRVTNWPVLVRKVTQLGRQSENDVEVVGRQHALQPPWDPLGLRHGRTLRAVPVVAGVVRRRADEAALLTHLDVPAERRGPATLHGVEDLALGDRQGALLLIGRPILENDVCEFERRPATLR